MKQNHLLEGKPATSAVVRKTALPADKKRGFSAYTRDDRLNPFLVLAGGRLAQLAPWLALLASIVYLFAGLAYSFFGLKQLHLPPAVLANARQPDKFKAETLEESLSAVSGRSLFSGPQSEKRDLGPAQPAGPDLLAGMSLVGIISSNNGPQVIIEDKSSHKTFYVTKGQFINDFQLEEIQGNKIILNLQGKRFELSQ